MNSAFGIVSAVLTLVGSSTELSHQPAVEQALELPVCTAVDETNCLYAPSKQDLAQLGQAAQACGLHDKTLTLERSPLEYAIKIDRTFGDAEERIDCALGRLPPDFHMKFGVGPIIVTIPDERPSSD
ncbi:MAG: hypothetical protein ABIS39_01490 [Sphingomicrobium sp.]